jgi:hypothetical protein
VPAKRSKPESKVDVSSTSDNQKAPKKSKTKQAKAPAGKGDIRSLFGKK